MSGWRARGNSARWKRLRSACFRRDGWTCTKCGRSPRRVRGLRLVAHHLRPVRLGGPDTLANVTTRCRECHFDDHRADGLGRRPATAWTRFRDELL